MNEVPPLGYHQTFIKLSLNFHIIYHSILLQYTNLLPFIKKRFFGVKLTQEHGGIEIPRDGHLHLNIQ